MRIFEVKKNLKAPAEVNCIRFWGNPAVINIYTHPGLEGNMMYYENRTL